KTPWEFCRHGKKYDVVLCAGDANLDGITTDLLLLYSSEKTATDDVRKMAPHDRRSGATLRVFGGGLPIYGHVATFGDTTSTILTEKVSGSSVGYLDQSRKNT